MNTTSPQQKDRQKSREGGILSGGRLTAFLTAILFNLFLMLLLYRIFTPTFEGNDDITIAQFVNGSCGSFDPHMVYQNYLIGVILSGLYRAAPLVPWYSWGQFLALCASFTAITYVLCCRVRKGAGFALSLLVQSFAAYECYIHIQYTKTAGVMAAAGMMLLWHALGGLPEGMSADVDRPDQAGTGRILWRDAAAGVFLCVCSIALRYAQFAACAALTAGIPLLMLLDAGRREDSGKPVFLRRSVFLRCLCACALLGALLLGLVRFDRSMYERDPVWKNYIEYNDTRSELMDYGMPEYEEYEDLYTRLGISRTAYDLFDTWNSGDTKVFSTEVMRELAAAREVQKPGLETAKAFVKEVPKGFLKNRIVWCFLVTAGLWFLFGRHDLRALAALVVETVLFAGLYYYLFLKGRYLYNRVDVGLWMSALTVLLWTWKPEHPDPAADTAGSRKEETAKGPAGEAGSRRFSINVNALRTVLILGVMAVCAFVQIPGWKDRLATHCEESRAKRAETRERMQEIAEDTDHLYVSKLGILSASRCCAPFEPIPQNLFSNTVMLGGWKVESAPYNTILEKYGFGDNPYEALTGLTVSGGDGDSKVLLLDEETEQTISYIREYYNPDAELIETGEWNGKTVWKIVTAGAARD